MSDRVLVDTNVLVCAYDRSEPEKQKRALEVLELGYKRSGCDQYLSAVRVFRRRNSKDSCSPVCG